jgi:hypothetical protein
MPKPEIVKKAGRIPPTVFAVGGGLLLFAGVYFGSVPDQAGTLARENLFGLLHELTGTTGQMLDHTEQLQSKVATVESKLGELQAQEKIVQQQKVTGERLAKELTRQEGLTTDGVRLMGDILVAEGKSVQAADDVTKKVASLTGQVEQNAATLAALREPLQRSQQSSEKLNRQLDLLIAELQRSKDSFALFVRVKDILKDPLKLPDILKDLPGLPGLPDVGNLPGNLPPVVTDPLPNLPGVPSLPSVPGIPTVPTIPTLPDPGNTLPQLPPLPSLPPVLPPTPTVPSLPTLPGGIKLP